MLPTEILIYINTFICKRQFNIEKDIIESLDIKHNYLSITQPCNIINYKGIQVCDKHDNIHLFNCFKVLNRITNKNISSIHFDTKECCFIAKSYISDFGNFSHFCCNGKGIMFRNNTDFLIEEQQVL